jgi:hypothetical protein
MILTKTKTLFVILNKNRAMDFFDNCLNRAKDIPIVIKQKNLFRHLFKKKDFKMSKQEFSEKK